MWVPGFELSQTCAVLPQEMDHNLRDRLSGGDRAPDHHAEAEYHKDAGIDGREMKDTFIET